MNRRRVAPGLAIAASVALAAGCGGPARFVSPHPPPDAVAHAWFVRDVPAAHAALIAAMERRGMAVDASASSPAVVVAVKHQLPYVDAVSGEPAKGPLPAYIVRAELSRDAGRTHVIMAVRADCPSCDGATPYEWERPTDLALRLLRHTASLLGERRARFAYPPEQPPELRRGR